MREHVVAAAKAMKTGNWSKCADYILAVKVGLLIWIRDILMSYYDSDANHLMSVAHFCKLL